VLFGTAGRRWIGGTADGLTVRTIATIYMPWMHSLVTTIYIDKLSMTDQLNSRATESEREGIPAASMP
jgi:hypothetical protein